jgi:hypothetical protein
MLVRLATSAVQKLLRPPNYPKATSGSFDSLPALQRILDLSPSHLVCLVEVHRSKHMSPLEYLESSSISEFASLTLENDVTKIRFDVKAFRFT